MTENELLIEHEGLLQGLARKLALRDCEVDDLLQEGRLALLHAWTRYDTSVGPFVAYASRVCRNCMVTWIRQHRGTVRVPHKIAARGVRTSTLSLDLPLSDDSNLTLGDTLAAPEVDLLPGNDVGLLERLWAAVDRLPEHERMVVNLRYRGDDKVTLAKLGEMMGLTPGAVHMMTVRAVKRLRGRLKSEE